MFIISSHLPDLSVASCGNPMCLLAWKSTKSFSSPAQVHWTKNTIHFPLIQADYFFILYFILSCGNSTNLFHSVKHFLILNGDSILGPIRWFTDGEDPSPWTTVDLTTSTRLCHPIPAPLLQSVSSDPAAWSLIASSVCKHTVGLTCLLLFGILWVLQK